MHCIENSLCNSKAQLTFTNAFLKCYLNSGQGRGGAQGRPRGGGRGRGFGRGREQGRGRGEKISAEDLDAELEKYHSEAMQIN